MSTNVKLDPAQKQTDIKTPTAPQSPGGVPFDGKSTLDSAQLPHEATEEAGPGCCGSLLQYLASFAQWIQDLCGSLFGAQAILEAQAGEPVDMNAMFRTWRTFERKKNLSYPCNIFFTMRYSSPKGTPSTIVVPAYHGMVFKDANFRRHIVDFCTKTKEWLAKHNSTITTATQYVEFGLYAFSKGSEPDTFNVTFHTYDPRKEGPNKDGLQRRTDVPLDEIDSFLNEVLLSEHIQEDTIFDEKGKLVEKHT